MQSYDVIVVGGGVIGSAVARELTRYRLSVAVLEKESDVCTQTSGRNTGMLHAGFLYRVCSTTTPRIKHQRKIGQLNRESASIWQKDQDKET